MTDQLLAWWQANAAVYLLGTVAWSAAGCVALTVLKAPPLRQRAAEATVAGWMIWLLLACVPVREVELVAVDQLARTAAPAITASADSIEFPLSPVTTLEPTGSTPGRLDALGIGLAAGSLLATCYLFGAWLLLRRLLHHARPAPVAVLELFETLPRSYRRAVRVVVSDRAWRPFCCGLRRPCIVLPSVMLETPPLDTQRSLRAVLLHELAHLDRGDLFGRLLFALTMPLAFWNPLFWQLRRHAHVAAELLADEVAACRHHDRAGYARALIDLAELLPAAREGRVVALGVFGPKAHFSQRMTMLISRRSPLATRCSRTASVIGSASAVALAAFASLGWTAPRLGAQQPKPIDPSPVQAPATPDVEKAPPKVGVLRFEMQVTYVPEADLGVIVTKLAGRGMTIEKLDIVPASDGRRSATLVFAMADIGLLRDVTALLAPASIVRCVPVVVNSERGGQPNPAMDVPRVYFAFENADVTKVIDTIAKISGTNIVIDAGVQGTVTMRVRGIPWREALEVAAQQVGATVREQADAILVVEPLPPAKR